MVTKRWFVILVQAVFVVIFAMGMLFPAGMIASAGDVPPEETTENTEEETPPEETDPETETGVTQETPEADESPEEDTAEPVEEDTIEPAEENAAEPEALDSTEEVTEGEPLEPTVDLEPVEELLPEVVPTEDPLLIPLVPLAEDLVDPVEIEELDTPAEVLAALPEEGELVILDENGEALPLVTAEAAEVVATGDPMWCPGTTEPGGTGCVDGFATIELAMDYAKTHGTGSFTIYVEETYNNTGVLTIDQTAFPYVGDDFNMFLIGGWDTLTNEIDSANTLDQALVIRNITGFLTIENMIINGSGPNSTIYIVDSEDVTLQNVAVNNFNGSHSVRVDNSHRVTVADSQIVENYDGYGMMITDSYDILIINSLVAENHRDGGIFMDNVQNVVLDTVDVTSGGNWCNGPGCSLDAIYIKEGTNVLLDGVTANSQYGSGFQSIFCDGYLSLIDSVFDGNGGFGVYIRVNDGPVSLDGVSAAGNGDTAVYIENMQDSVTIENSIFSDNHGSYGLAVMADSVGISDTQVDDNDLYGAYLWVDQWVEILTSTFSGNENGYGLYAFTENDYILIDGFNANDNEGYGAQLDAETDLILRNAAMNGNDEYGLYAQADQGTMLLENVWVSSNGWDTTVNPNGFGLNLISMGDMILNEVVSYENFDYGLVAYTDGTLTISDAEFFQNGWGNFFSSTMDMDGYGARLISTLDMTITDTIFNFNYNEGLHAEAGISGGPHPTTGNITLEYVNADYNGYPDETAPLENTNAYGMTFMTNGTMTIHHSTFDNNGYYGLAGQANEGLIMTYSSASGNLENGTVVQSPGNIEVTCSVFNDNGSIGLVAGATGLGSSVTLNGDQYEGNGFGDYLVWAGDLIENTAYPCGGGTTGGGPAGDGGPYVPPWLAGLIPVTGGDFVSLSCTGVSILQLPTGEMVVFNQPMCGYMGALEPVVPEDLPGELAGGWEFVNGFTVSLLFGEDVIIQLPAGWTDTLAFPILEEQTGDEFHILYWDVTSSGGLGDWVDLGGVKEALKWVKTHNAVGTFLLVL